MRLPIPLRSRLARPRLILAVVLSGALATGPAHAHDIPNSRIDRSIQATVVPARLVVAYEVSLSELTLTQDLRTVLDGPLPGGDRESWFNRYGEVVGPLIGRGLTVVVAGREIDSRMTAFSWKSEGHPVFTFAFEAPLPPTGRLRIRDGNYVASEGTSRLAIRGREGVTLQGDFGPENVEAIPIRPIWELSDVDERRTREVRVDYETAGPRASAVAHVISPEPRRSGGGGAGSLSGLLRGQGGASWAGLAVMAFGLGMTHALQPGHGKTLVAAATLGRRGERFRSLALAWLVTAVHLGVVLVIALGLWATRSVRYAAIDRDLTHLAGFAIAAMGCWRLGRHLANRVEPAVPAEWVGMRPREDRGWVGLGLAAGLVPCWDAVLLVILAEALGRLPMGIALLGAFGLGMTTVLAAVGALAGRVHSVLSRQGEGVNWSRRLGLAGGATLAVIGIVMLAR